MTSQSQLAHYFQEAALLRSCLAFNLMDFEFANSGGRIVYLVDANIVRFFINPELETRHVLPFRSEAAPDYAAATALITAEFLFSRSLAGQHGAPAFITPAHGREVGDILTAIKEDSAVYSENNGAPVELLGEKKVALKQLLSNLNAGTIDRVKAVGVLEQSVPELAKLLLNDGFQAPAQMLRLYNDDLLRPLAVHTAATNEVLYPDPAEIRRWEKRILEFRHPETRRDHEKIRNDAESIVQVTLLDRVADEEGVDADGQRTRYVMVSADHSLIDTYVKWYWDSDPSVRGRFLLRLPLQFAPILNIFEMPNGIETGQLTTRACAALDSLLARHQETDSGFLDKLLWYRLMSRSGGANAESVRLFFGSDLLSLDARAATEFERFRELWHTSFRTGVVLNTKLMNRRRAEFDFLATVIGSDADLRQKIYEHQQKNLEKIEAAHAAFTTRLNLRSLMQGRKGEAVNQGRQRAELLIRAQFSDIFGERPLQHALRDLPADEGLVARAEEVVRAEDSRAFLLAACVAYLCGQWTYAAIYALRARELTVRETGPDEILGEAAFLYASALRYGLAAGPMGDELRLADVAKAVDLLKEAIEDCAFRRDAFGGARALCEINSLTMFCLYYQYLGGNLSGEIKTPEIDGYRRNVERANTLIAAARKERDPRVTEDMIEDLEALIISNHLSAAVLTKVIKQSANWSALIDPSEAELIESIRLIDREHADGVGHPVMAAESLMIRWWWREIDTESASLEVGRLVEVAQKDPSALTMDVAEITSFQNILIAAR